MENLCKCSFVGADQSLLFLDPKRSNYWQKEIHLVLLLQFSTAWRQSWQCMLSFEIFDRRLHFVVYQRNISDRKHRKLTAPKPFFVLRLRRWCTGVPRIVLPLSFSAAKKRATCATSSAEPATDTQHYIRSSCRQVLRAIVSISIRVFLFESARVTLTRHQTSLRHPKASKQQQCHWGESAKRLWTYFRSAYFVCNIADAC